MSLGTFFRDYVYIPLGGNRHDQQRNILVVWFLTGLWHGAAWNFILWGLYYAFLLMFEKRILLGWFKKIPKIAADIVGHVYTVFITVFGFAIFYFDKGLFKNLGYLFGIGTASGTDIFTESILLDNILLLAAAVFFAIPVIPALWEKVKGKIPYPAERIVKTAVVVVLIGAATVRLVGNSYSPFLYFRF
jgi:alginate O-acetyltransferase complex protein AlgI